MRTGFLPHSLMFSGRWIVMSRNPAATPPTAASDNVSRLIALGALVLLSYQHHPWQHADLDPLPGRHRLAVIHRSA